MRLILFACLLPALLTACLVEPPAPPPSPFDAKAKPSTVSTASTAGLSGARFFCRTNRGEERTLGLRKLAVAVTTNPGTVRSHLTMELAGPASERVEAVMRLAVPRGAAVTRAVLWVNGRPMNGAFVQRDRAQQIYRSIVERRRDPALVTWDGPGWVAVSIFPLEYGQPRRFELEWVEPAASNGGFLQYRVPELAEAGRVVGRPSLEVDGKPLPIGGREVVPLGPAPGGAPRIVGGRAPGDPFQRLLVRAPDVDGAPRLVLVAETSAAMTPADRIDQRAAIEAVLRALPSGAKTTIVAADWSVATVADDEDPAGAERALAKLDGIVSAGALHLGRALGDAAARARKLQATAVLFVGRGLDGFGGDALHAPLGALRDAGVRLSVIFTGELPAPLADAAALTGGEALTTRALDEDLRALVGALRPRPPLPTMAARGTDDWRALETITGQTVWVGRARQAPASPAGAADAIVPTDPEDLVPLWDRARLAWSDRDGRVAPDRTTPAALTPLRSLLVLETEQDYARFGLIAPERVVGLRHTGAEGKMSKVGKRLTEEQTKNADILGLLGRNSSAHLAPGFAADTPAEGRSAEDVISGVIGNAYGVGGLGILGTGSAGGGSGEATIGLGNLGTIGKGGGGGNGSGHGRGAGGLGGRRARAPDVVPGVANVRGSLDKEIIRRIIRRHINEVRFCYEQQLVRRPDLGGRVLVQFTIAASGQVIASVLQSSTLGDDQVDRCIVQAVRRWEFPRPLGGIVIVSYPFVLTPSETTIGVTGPVETVGPAVDPTTADALALLAGHGELDDRVARIAALMGLDRTSDPESLAWMIDRQGAGLRELTLVARLLVAAKRAPDAVRVLSERASLEPGRVAAELRRMDAPADAAEVVALAKRGR